MTIEQIANAIAPADEAARAACTAHWNSVGKPLGSLGLLETSLERIAALTGSPQIELSPRTLLVFCADNGVVCEGVTQTDASVTAAVARALTDGYSSACVFAKKTGTRVLPVDMGILDMPEYPGLRRCRMDNGTKNIAVGPAMTREQAEQAVLCGVELVREQKEAGAKLIVTGEMGIGNTTTGAALCCAWLGLPPETAVGRGAGLSDAGLERKVNAVKRALEANQDSLNDALSTLAALGGFDIAAMAGAFIGGALYNIPVLIDGFISAAAALAALHICPACQKAMLATHVSAEPAGAALLKTLGLQPLITAGMRLGEGTGALAALPLLDLALELYNGSDFSAYGMEAYTPQ